MALDPATRTAQLAELLAEPPPRHRVPKDLRKAAMRQAAPGFLIPFGALFAAIGLFLAWIFVPWNFMEDVKLKEGVTTPGVVLSASPTDMSINSTQVMRYAFKYQPKDGAEMRGECFTTGSRWQEGDAVTVRYLAGNPAISVIDGARRSPGTLGVAFVLIFPVIGFGLIAWVVIARRRMNALLQNGTVTEALVTRIEETSVQVNRRYVQAIALQCNDGAALVARRHQPEIVAFAHERMATQQPVFVLYDPARPKRILLPETLH
jgi:hypothetical protein